MLATQHDICGCCRATPVYDFCVLVFDPSYPGLVLSVRDVEFSSGCRCPELNLFGFKILGWTPEREAPGRHRQGTAGSAPRGEGGERDLRVLNLWAGNRGGGLVPTKEFKKGRSTRVPAPPWAGSKSNTAAAGNLPQFGEGKKRKNRSQKSKNHNYL